jgi:hypothetical protein
MGALEETRATCGADHSVPQPPPPPPEPEPDLHIDMRDID